MSNRNPLIFKLVSMKNKGMLLYIYMSIGIPGFWD